jgi:hypothetical protein
MRRSAGSPAGDYRQQTGISTKTARCAAVANRPAGRSGGIGAADKILDFGTINPATFNA